MTATAERPEGDLLYLGSLAELITSLTGRFVNFAPGGLDSEINRTLRAIGEFAGVDRSYVFRFLADGTRVSNTHEWCAPGIEAVIDRVQDVPLDRFAWPLLDMQRGDVLYVENVSELPPGVGDIKQELENQGVKSLVCLPLKCSGKVLGFVGFDSVRQPKSWSDRDINLLKVVGEILANAMEREAATERLQRQVEMETLVANTSTRFIRVATIALDDEINDAIRAIGEFTGVDRSYVFCLSTDGRRMTNTHEWCAQGVEPHIDRLRDLPVELFRYSMAVMRQGEVFYVPDVSALPDEASAERSEFEQEGIKTLINVPIMARGGMTGFLGLDAVRERKLWSEDDTRLLMLVGEIFGNALERKAAQTELQKSLDEKEVLLREIHHRVKNNLQIVDSLLYLQTNAVKHGADAGAADAFRQSQSRVRAMAQIHEQLYRSKDIGRLGFCEYLSDLVPGLRDTYELGSDIQVDVCGCDTILGIDQAIPCGLVVNELITNGLKHAFPHGGPGRISVCLEQTEANAYVLTVSDDGIGFDFLSLSSQKRALGLRLVKDLAAQLDGTVEFENTDPGTCVTVRF